MTKPMPPLAEKSEGKTVLDAVALTRRIREAHHRAHGHRPLKEQAERLARRGRQSPLWQRLQEQEPAAT